MLPGFLAIAAVVTYVSATRHTRPAWPAHRTACFGAGGVTVALAASIDGGSFSAHATQHLLSGMVAPILFALAAPITLALRALRPGRRRHLLRLLHHRAVRTISHPVVAWALFGGSLLALYTTPLYRLSLENSWLHEAVHLHFLLAGALFFFVVFGVDPGPRRLHHGARLLMVFLAIPFHAVVGIALLTASTPLADAHTIADQRTGAGVLWIGGDLLGLLAVLVVAARWMADDERQAAREDRRAAY